MIQYITLDSQTYILQIMIQYITLDSQTYTFIDFLELTEGISPRQTQYEYTRDARSHYGKFNVDGEPVLCVLFKTMRPGWYEVGFGKHIAGKPTDNGPENYTMTEQIPTQKFFDLFGKVLYVIIDICNNKIDDVERLRFSGGYEAISRFYTVLMQNKMFVKKLAQFGFELDPEMMKKYGSDIFVLKRIR